ncbi:CoA transferase subunit A [Ferroacidibacillus organovorans]|uniref:Succinyl-CoA--3-ketoacid-CoA transferase n=1 Tax=Ferroacidibacillus organovorans TaxID=1765683 RepID=A0A161QEW3_9BACL|nr:CoA transferase subunit A [Ferroacidibacillus organovorans]KYP80390.1 succinyl-CoA--3-ketoacid-CoA transferase [Ferroacidibacillus organovorans]OAG93169.1 succinyl-CoA--3-ketoacid-CoA transferase [Ferroacidibacillus organovorans]OPG17265.1 succinyl-CoA--3-ketoacid-CoA transferase [Ferroacidibacillus organovorans]
MAGVSFTTLEEAARNVKTGMRVMVGGFGLAGVPDQLVYTVRKKTETRDLTVISNNISVGTQADALFQEGRIKKAIGSYFTTNPSVVQAYREGRVEIELLPQGTFAEAIRLGGAGIAAFYTPTAAGTELAIGKEVRMFDGREHVLERALRADVALIHAYKADRAGNLVYRKSSRNFNPLMAMAADYVIVEVEHLVDVGELAPDEIVTPFIFIDEVVVAARR